MDVYLKLSFIMENKNCFQIIFTKILFTIIETKL